MIHRIEKINAPNNVVDTSGFSSDDTIIVSDAIKRIRFSSDVSLRSLVMSPGTTAVFEGDANVIGMTGGRLLFMGDVTISALSAFDDVMIKGSATLGGGDFTVSNGSLMIRGDVELCSDICVPDGCVRMTGKVSEGYDILSDDVWAPSRKLRSRSKNQRDAAENLFFLFGKDEKRGVVHRVISSFSP